MKKRTHRRRLPRLPRLPRWLRLPRSPRARRTTVAGVVLAVLALWFCRGDDGRRTWPQSEILAAIRYVESSDRDDVDDGDGGKAIGPFQIHLVYWQDAQRAQPTIGGTYQDCRQRAYAERIVRAYMRHHAADAWANGEAEVIARIHNGGPAGHRKDATLGYWRRVRARLP